MEIHMIEPHILVLFAQSSCILSYIV